MWCAEIDFDTEKCTLIDFKSVGEQDAHVLQHLVFDQTPAQLQILAEEVKAEQAARKHGDFVERESLVLWEEELPYYGKELEDTIIKDDDDGTVRI